MAVTVESATSQRAHETMTDLAGRALATPEFMRGLGRSFFGRSFDNGGRSTIADGVLFPLNESKYRLSWHAEPLRFGPNEIRNYNVNMRLGLLKFDPQEEDPDQATKARLNLYSSFEEDQDGNVIAYKYGSIRLEDGTDVDTTQTAFEKIPTIFSDFYRTLKL